MGVGTVTVAMAGAAVSSSDFSSSILGTPGASEDKSFKIFLAKTVCCKDFNQNGKEKKKTQKIYLIHNAGENWKVQQRKYGCRMKNSHYLQTLTGEDAQRGKRHQHRIAVLINMRYRCPSTGSSQANIQLSQPFLFLESMFLSHPFLLVSWF